MLEISQRRLESLLRAEDVARELRWQFSSNQWDAVVLHELVVRWMAKTGKHKYERPRRRR